MRRAEVGCNQIKQDAILSEILFRVPTPVKGILSNSCSPLVLT